MAELFEADAEAGEDPVIASETSAVAIALERARNRRGAKKGDDALDRFLDDQRALIADQRHQLHEQFRHLGLKLWSERLKLALQALTVLVGLLVLGVVAWMAWEAHSADGLVIKPFSMPPALTQRGVTGEAVASEVMDQLSAMAEIARPSERQKSVAADWGSNISIEIPETGVSLSQVDQWLREKLGHQRRVTGEVSLNPDGTLTLGARIGAHPLAKQTGPEADLDRMETKLAEAIYGQEQPISMYQYLANQGRWEEALARSQVGLRISRTPEQRAMSMNGVGLAVQNLKGDLAAKPYYEQALAMTPNINQFVPGNLSNIEGELGHTERQLALVRLSMARARVSETETPEARHINELADEAAIAAALGDHAEALRDQGAVQRTNMAGYVGEMLSAVTAPDRAALHETTAAISELQASEPHDALPRAVTAGNLSVAYGLAGDWQNALLQVDRSAAAATAMPDHGAALALTINSSRALALAKLGRVADAQRLADPLPLDCAPCLVARGEVAEAAGDHRTADHWYAEAVRLTPSLPTANETWGRALLARGDAKAALARFEAARAKGPRFADAVEGAAEARLALGDAEAATRDFAEAARLAPRWGRLHMKWGEALARQGKAAEAKAQFASATALDLTPSERAELAAQRV
jgi:tetratricopeptide (TPR) repeat protein